MTRKAVRKRRLHVGVAFATIGVCALISPVTAGAVQREATGARAQNHREATGARTQHHKANALKASAASPFDGSWTFTWTEAFSGSGSQSVSEIVNPDNPYGILPQTIYTDQTTDTDSEVYSGTATATVSGGVTTVDSATESQTLSYDDEYSGTWYPGSTTEQSSFSGSTVESSVGPNAPVSGTPANLLSITPSGSSSTGYSLPYPISSPVLGGPAYGLNANEQFPTNIVYTQNGVTAAPEPETLAGGDSFDGSFISDGYATPYYGPAAAFVGTGNDPVLTSTDGIHYQVSAATSAPYDPDESACGVFVELEVICSASGSGTWTINATAVFTPNPPVAAFANLDATGQYSGTRGSPVTLDGSASTGIGLTYNWDFQPGSDCPEGTILTNPSINTNTTATITFTPLCSLAVTLTVTDAINQSATASTVLVVAPRTGPEWDAASGCTLGDPNCPDFTYTEDTSGTNPLAPNCPNFEISGYAPAPDTGPCVEGDDGWDGLNVAGCDPWLSIFCPAPDPTTNSWDNLGYVTETLNDGGPFDQFSFVSSESLRIEDEGLFNPWEEPNSEPLCVWVTLQKKKGPVTKEFCSGSNWYDKNRKDGSTTYLTGVHMHEGMGDGQNQYTGHAIAMEAAYMSEAGNANKMLEGLFTAPGASTSIQASADQAIVAATSAITSNSGDCTLYNKGPHGPYQGSYGLSLWVPPYSSTGIPNTPHGWVGYREFPIAHCP